MKTANKFGFGLAATIGLSALLMGLAGATPAQADEWEHYGRGHIYREIADVRRDERLLRVLQAEHDEARRCHDWPRMHALDRRISDLRRHIEQDRRDIREDISRTRDRDRYRSDRYRSDDRYREDRARYRVRYDR
jgi:hypothetical protein